MLAFLKLINKFIFMPTIKNSSKNTAVKGSAGVKKSTNKKQTPVNIKTPTARQRAQEFDAGRRNDANSNEL